MNNSLQVSFAKLTIARGSFFWLQRRSIGFFSQHQADQVWKGVTIVSNPARKKGKGALAKKYVNLNRGRSIGSGASGHIWPGLTETIFDDSGQISPIVKGQGNEITESIAAKFTGKFGGRKRIRLKLPHEYRGYTGSQLQGMRIDNPQNTENYNYDDFETRILKLKYVGVAQKGLSKQLRLSCIVATGNKDGLIGIGYGKSSTVNSAVNIARNRASKCLIRYKLLDNRTVFHNFASQCNKTYILVYRKSKGFGISCQRVLKILCDLIGIKDIRIKIDNNPQNIDALIKAFQDGLLQMKDYQQISNETGLNLVELSDDIYQVPVVLSRPSQQYIKTQEKEPYRDYRFENFFFPGGRQPVEVPIDSRLLKSKTYRGIKKYHEKERLKLDQRIREEAFDIFENVSFHKNKVH